MGMAHQPSVPLRLVGVEIVYDHVQLASRVGGDDVVHEVEKFTPPTAVVMPHLHIPTGHL